MDIHHKLYPYPVMSSVSDDYLDSYFRVDVNEKIYGNGLELNFIVDLVNDEIAQLLVEGKVSFVYHLECAQTGYRKAILTDEYEFRHTISNKDINGRLQICPFIVASNDLIKYTNRSFHPDYSGYMFQIDAGCIMAVGEQVNIDIEKDLTELAKIPSVFTIIKNDDPAAKSMIVSLDENKIVIQLPEQEFHNAKSIESAPEVQPLLNSLVIVPALIYVLEEVSKYSVYDRYEFSSYSWYRAIKKALSEKFQCDIEKESFSNENIMKIAQELIDSPLKESLSMLAGDKYLTVEMEENEDQ